ncbi:MAG: UDP-N-acetylmuramate dehydrogenase [Candidatus Levyibacteriota bacterium]|nr:MAG: UDP-N-acetylmuramate dehydrogenase [Candidatus Levybacteria bacterium]
MDTKLKELEKIFGQNRVRLDEPMSAHTTFKIGGKAQYYIDIDKTDDIVKAVKAAKTLDLPFFIFGSGSNIIVADCGIKGLIIKNNCRKFDIAILSGRVKNQKIDVGKALVVAESGVIINQLVRFAIEKGLSGLEYQLGLPGTVGGAVYMNSNFPRKGAYIGDCVFSAKLVTKEGEIKEVDKTYFHFVYDYSVLQETGDIVLSVVFRMTPADTKVLWERGMEALEYRNNSQPKGASAGCTFRNISIVEAISIPTPDRITSAGYLIDKAGFKGKRIGDAMISDRHANFILNMGNARGEDVVELVRLIKDEVFKKFNVKLHLEVKTVGF